MAQYVVTHTCGHTHTYNLVGAHSERDRKIEWLEGQACPACRREAAIAAAAADTTPITATIKPMIAGDSCRVCVVLQGGTMARREDIKAAGYSWGEPPVEAGVFGVFARPEKRWYRVVALDAETLAAGREAVVASIKAALPADCTLAVGNAADDAMLVDVLKSAIAKAKADADAKAKMPPKPQMPGIRELVGAPLDGRWNGKFYGKAKNEVYINNKLYTLTAEQIAAYNARCAALAAWQAECDAIAKAN